MLIDGFLYVGIQDKNVYTENFSVYIPLATMTSFLPYHFVSFRAAISLKI
jgi:hypothetical protein